MSCKLRHDDVKEIIFDGLISAGLTPKASIRLATVYSKVVCFDALYYKGTINDLVEELNDLNVRMHDGLRMTIDSLIEADDK